MDFLKKYFPYSFKERNAVPELVKGIIIYVVVAIVAGLVLTLTGFLNGLIPVPFLGTLVGFVLGAVGTLVEVYATAGIVIMILVYTKVIKE